MSRVLILGGAGFIGYHLAGHLADEGVRAITLVDDLSRGRIDDDLSALLARPGVELVRADGSADAPSFSGRSPQPGERGRTSPAW